MFTLAGVKAVNGQNRQDLGYLRTFTVTANVSSAADGTASVPIYPPITIAPSPAQTVTASPFTDTITTAYDNSMVVDYFLDSNAAILGSFIRTTKCVPENSARG